MPTEPCPFLHAEDHAFVSTAGAPDRCKACGGVSRSCPSCGSRARQAASFCPACGAALPGPAAVPAAAAGYLREKLQSLEEEPPRTLEALLGLSADERAVAWYSTGSGVLTVVMRNADWPCALYLLEPQHLAFATRAGRAVGLGELPPINDWLMSPAIGPAGFLLAATGGLRARLWLAPSMAVPMVGLGDLPPPGAEGFAGHAVGTDGRFVLALRRAGRLFLATGLGRGAWRTGQVLPDGLGHDGGIALGPVHGGTGFWLTDGTEVLYWEGSPDREPTLALHLAPDHRFTLPEGQRARQDAHPVAPLAVQAGPGAKPGLVLPTRAQGGNGLSLLPLVPGGAAHALASLSGPHSFCVADPLSGGVLLGQGGQIDCLSQDRAALWSLSLEGGRNLPPVSIGDQMVLLSARIGATAMSTRQEAELAVRRRSAAGAADVVTRRFLLGRPAQAFPPLLVGSRLVYATTVAGEGTRLRTFDLTEGADMAGGT